MPRFAANIRMMFQEVPLLERFGAAAEAGFRGVEHQFPYGGPVDEIRTRLDDTSLEMVLINAPPGDWEVGERGLAAVPGRTEEFKATIDEAMACALRLGCRRVHVMAGVPGPETSTETAMAVYAENLRYAAETLGREGIAVLIEPLNAIDVPGYVLGSAVQARAVMAVVNRPNLFLQYDLYHGAMSGEDLLETVRDNLDVIGHLQVASAPGRHEPTTADADGEINHIALFEAIDGMGYGGWIGCEYEPCEGTLKGLGWASVFGIGKPFRSVD